MAVEAFSCVLMQIPTSLDNAGYDLSEFVTRLRAAHYDGHHDAELDVENGGIEEAQRFISSRVLSATEASETIIHSK